MLELHTALNDLMAEQLKHEHELLASENSQPLWLRIASCKSTRLPLSRRNLVNEGTLHQNCMSIVVVESRLLLSTSGDDAMDLWTRCKSTCHGCYEHLIVTHIQRLGTLVPTRAERIERLRRPDS